MARTASGDAFEQLEMLVDRVRKVGELELTAVGVPNVRRQRRAAQDGWKSE